MAKAFLNKVGEVTGVVSLDTFNKLSKSVAELVGVVEKLDKDPKIFGGNSADLGDGWKSAIVSVSVGDGTRQVTFVKGMLSDSFVIDNFYNPKEEYWWQRADLIVRIEGNNLTTELTNFRQAGLKKNALTAPSWSSNNNEQAWIIKSIAVMY